MANHAVVRTDLMYATDVRSGLVSIRYLGADGETPTAIDNGNVIKCGALQEGEREIHVGIDMASDDAITDVVLIAAPELMYDERKHNLDDFYVLPNRPARGYRFHPGDVFSVTAEALDGTPAVDSKVTLADGTKLAVDGSGTVLGTIIAKDVVGRHTYYAIEVSVEAAE